MFCTFRIATHKTRILLALFGLTSLGQPMAEGQGPAIAQRLRQDRGRPAMTKTRRVIGEVFTVRSVGAEPVGGAHSLQPFPTGRLVYSNKLGNVAIVPGAGRLIADDISTTGANGCRLIRYSFKVAGQVDPQGVGGPFRVDFALYSQCPLAAPPNERDFFIIPATIGSAQFDDDDAYEISFISPPSAFTNIPNSLWLAVTFSRDNAGVIGGAPPLEGFSADEFAELDTCNANLGHFPEHPHASFDAEIHVERDCPAVHLGYKADNLQGQAISTNSGWIVDDLQLLDGGCRIVAYEVGVLPGAVEVELRDRCLGLPFPGSQLHLIMEYSANAPLVIRHDLPEPIPSRTHVSVAVRSNHGVVIAGEPAEVGFTADFFELQDMDGACNVASGPNPYEPAALQVSLICQGETPKGACCDYLVEQCNGGERHDARCHADADCPGGSCASQCREVPLLNCPFLREGDDFQPMWDSRETCNDPFPDHRPCSGRFACCFEDVDKALRCQNLSRSECLARNPVGVEEKWQRGQHCGLGQQICALPDCLGATGDCFEPQTTPGCGDLTCCTAICYQDDFCCEVEWDAQCVQTMIESCDPPAQNDDCKSAKHLSLPANTYGRHTWAKRWDPNEVACCQNSPVRVCTDPLEGYPCTTDEDCRFYTLTGRCLPAPGTVFAGLWYEFVARNTSARIRTCSTTSAPTADSIIQVFAVGDDATPESSCASLISIACGDDNCGINGRLSGVCVDSLRIGETYYVLVGAKSHEAIADYNLTVGSTPCTTGHDPPNDACFFPQWVNEGSYSFDLANAELDCPADYCDLFAEADVWFNYQGFGQRAHARRHLRSDIARRNPHPGVRGLRSLPAALARASRLPGPRGRLRPRRARHSRRLRRGGWPVLPRPRHHQRRHAPSR